MSDDIETSAVEQPQRKRKSSGAEGAPKMTEPKIGDKVRVRVVASDDPALQGKERCRKPLDGGGRRYFTREAEEVTLDRPLLKLIQSGNLEVVEG